MSHADLIVFAGYGFVALGALWVLGRIVKVLFVIAWRMFSH